MIDEKEFTAAVKNQIEAVKTETKIFVDKIFDLHVNFAKKNAPELVGGTDCEIQQAKAELVDEILECMGFDEFEEDVKRLLAKMQAKENEGV